MHNHQPEPQPGSRRQRAALLMGALALLVAVVGGYYAYWRIVAEQLEAGVEAWAAEQRALGNEVAFAWDGISGFPFQFAATFRDPKLRWHWLRGEAAWQGASLDAEMTPWNLRRIAVKSNGWHEVAVQLADGAAEYQLEATGFSGTVHLHGSGAPRGVTLALQQPDVIFPDGMAVEGADATVTVDLPASPPGDYRNPLGRVTVDASSIALPPGTRLLTVEPIETLSLDATIKGPMPLAPLREALGAWRDAGGVVDLSSFAFRQGPLRLTGSATIALDAALQPEGAGTITSSGLSEAVEILIQDGFIPSDRALIARTTAKALEKPGPDGRLQATVGLSIQNRTVSFGPVPLFELQPIEWP